MVTEDSWDWEVLRSELDLPATVENVDLKMKMKGMSHIES